MATRRKNNVYQERVVLPFDHEGLTGSGTTPAVAATGLITCVTKANFADSDFMTIPDGINPAVLYEFDEAGDGVTAGREQVDISGATTAADCAAILATAIAAAQPGLAIVDPADGTLELTHEVAGTVGNGTITENVANAGFLVSGMSGGLDLNPNTTADATIKLWKLPRTFRVDRVLYINPEGLAEDADNHFNVALMNGATVVANFSSDSDDPGDNNIPADTFIDLALTATDADRVFAADDIMSLFLDEGGTAELPPGRIVVEGRLL